MALTDVKQAGLNDEAANESKLQISNAGTNGQYLQKQSGATGGLTWATVDQSALMPLAGGTFTGDVTFAGNTSGRDVLWDKSQDGLIIKDNTKLYIGDGGDLNIYHDGTDTYIYNSAPNLYFRSASNDKLMTLINDGAVELYHNNVKKLWTESWGINIDGNLALGDSEELIFGGSDDFKIYHNGTESYVNELNNHLIIRTTTANKNIYIQSEGSILLGDVGANEYSAKFINDGAVELYHDNTKRFETVSDGIRWTGHCYANDNYKLRLGTGEDLQIYHDGSNSIMTDSSSGFNFKGAQFNILNAADSEYVARFKENDAVELYYNGVKKLETTSGGVAVTGTEIKLQASGETATVQVIGGEGKDAKIEMLADEGDDADDKWLMAANAGGSDWRLYGYAGGSWKEYIAAHGNAHVLLSYANAGKVETTSSGCTVYGSVNETSDIALKKDVSPITNALANIKQLNGYSYTFKDTNHKSLGLTTQDVEKVYPDLVEGEEGTKTLQYSGIIAPLVEAIKELSTDIETLKTKVAALEAA
jgi:hypothetical protein